MLNLNSAEAGFADEFDRFIAKNREAPKDLREGVARIVGAVASEGDAALLRYAAEFDHFTPDPIEMEQSEIHKLASLAPKEECEALELAARRIGDYHQRQLPENCDYEDAQGARLGWRYSPIHSVGIYVPGGLASYPSTLLMNAIPARIAGVKEIAASIPCPHGEINPLVLAAAKIAGVTRIYRIGGAQAIAAMAYGTKSVGAVDKIVGPGNAYVAEAKRQVFGKVGIDMIAGPSEVLVIADADNDPGWLALDLLSQAEHDQNAQAILITDSDELARKTGAAVEEALATLPRANIARASWEENGAIIKVADLEQAAMLADRIAPEHLQICTKEPRALLEKISCAGAIFLGALTPEAIGDYVGGPNHVLPTSGTARFASGLGVIDFLKRSSVLEISREALLAIGPASEILARAEGLDAHANSVGVRLADLSRRKG